MLRGGPSIKPVFPPEPWTIDRFSQGEAVVEWRIKLEARNGWGEIETIELAHFNRRDWV
jgi:hypothetical protein